MKKILFSIMMVISINFVQADNELFIPYFGDTELWYQIGDNQLGVFTGTNQPPTFNQTINDYSIHHNNSLSVQVNCSDDDGDTIYYFDNTSLFDISATGLISDNPSYNENNSYNILVSCGDDFDNSTDAFVYRIINDAPFFTLFSPSNTTILGTNYSNLSVRAHDNEGDTLTYEFYNGTSPNTLTLLYNGTNSSYNFTGLPDDIYYWQVNISDKLNSNLSGIRQFQISTTAPAINLKYPKDDRYYKNNLTIFNLTVYDTDGTETCLLYGTWSGIFLKNQTLRNPINDATIENNFTDKIPLADGEYIYGAWCNDTNGNAQFSSNFTFNIDTVYPSFKSTSPIEGQSFSTQNITITNNASDLNLYQCFYSIYLAGALVRGNTSINCNGQTYYNTGAWSEDWIFYGYSEDLAGNINSSGAISFSTTQPTVIPPPEEGGGVAPPPPLEEIIKELVDICGNDECEDSETPWDCPEDCRLDLFDPEILKKAWVIRIFAWALVMWFIFVTFLPKKKKKKKEKV